MTQSNNTNGDLTAEPDSCLLVKRKNKINKIIPSKNLNFIVPINIFIRSTSRAFSYICYHLQTFLLTYNVRFLHCNATSIGILFIKSLAKQPRNLLIVNLIFNCYWMWVNGNYAIFDGYLIHRTDYFITRNTGIIELIHN